MGAIGLPARRARRRATAISLAAAILALLLAGCGAAPAVGSGVALAEPTATATATPRPTATATVAPTATVARISTVAPTATATPRPSPPAATATLVGNFDPPRPPVMPTIVPGGYVANWARWAVGEQSGQFSRRYDTATGDYRVDLLSDDQQWSFFAPEGQKFQDFTLEVEAHQTRGSDLAGYGLSFRRQKADGDARYIFYVTAQGRFALTQIKPDGSAQILRPLDAARPGVIRVGRETNRLRVTCQGATIILAVNNVEVHRITNATITQAGEIGIFAIAPAGARPTELAFRGLWLNPLR